MDCARTIALVSVRLPMLTRARRVGRRAGNRAERWTNHIQFLGELAGNRTLLLVLRPDGRHVLRLARACGVSRAREVRGMRRGLLLCGLLAASRRHETTGGAESRQGRRGVTRPRINSVAGSPLAWKGEGAQLFAWCGGRGAAVACLWHPLRRQGARHECVFYHLHSPCSARA